MQKIKLIYLVGFWRSGGTILGRILGCSEQVIFVGNINDFWRKENSEIINVVVAKDLIIVVFGRM